MRGWQYTGKWDRNSSSNWDRFWGLFVWLVPLDCSVKLDKTANENSLAKTRTRYKDTAVTKTPPLLSSPDT